MNECCAILVNYNGYNDTIECIESIEKSSILVDVIIVDNASAGNEYDMLIEKYALYKNVHVIRSSENRGFSAGNNIGIKYAMENGYEYIVLLNNDTVVEANMFESLISNAKDNIVTTPLMYYYSNPKCIWFGGGRISRLTGNGHSINKGLIDNGNIYKDIMQCTFATGCCLAIKTSVFNQIGLLDETYFMYCEDTDFCIRLQQANIKINLVPTAKLWHKVSQSTGGEHSPFSIYYITRNRLHYVKKYRRFLGYTAYIISIITRLIRYIQYLFRNNELAYYMKLAIKDHFNNVTGQVKLERNDT